MIREILRRAGAVRDDEPGLVLHIGQHSAPTIKPRWLQARDRVLDLDTACGHEPLLPEPDRGEAPAPAGFAALLAASLTDLRRAIALSEWLPKAPYLAVGLGHVPAHWGPPVPAPPAQNEWRHLEDLQVRRRARGSWLVELFFLEPAPLGEVIAAIARAQGGSRRHRVPYPLVALTGEPSALGESSMWRPADTGVTAAPPAGPARTVGVTPAADLVLRSAAGDALPAWQDERLRVVDRTPIDTAADLTTLSPDELAPIDERVVNPAGFEYHTQRGIARLWHRDEEWRLDGDEGTLVTVPSCGTVTDVDLSVLRNLRGARIDWGEAPTTPVGLRAVASLAAAGIPLFAAAPPPWTAALGRELRALLGAVDPTDLDDELLREEHSVRLRRAALRTHGARARWRSIGAELGLPQPPEPTISVILCTRRPTMVGFALRQVARQRRVDLEVVLTLHGFDSDTPGVREAVAEFTAAGHPLKLLTADADTIYGKVLNRALAHTSGSLVAKMDDDDWYSPEHLADLLLAREYSGAEVVGCGQEFVYLEELDITVRRASKSERPFRWVAGGGFLMGRNVLEDVGGFRPLPRAIDTQLLTAILKGGGRVYRTHSLGYVLQRKRAVGEHTWRESTGYFLRNSVRQWQGWRPSALVEPDPRDEPAGAVAAMSSASMHHTTGART